jgi:rhamnosyl/mannosyltransferase
MNILQVSKYFHPYIGGIEVAVSSLSKGLADDHTVRILAARNDRQSVRVDDESNPKVSLIKSYGEVRSVPIAPGFPNRLRREYKQADLVHYHLPNPLAVMSHLALLQRDVTTVATYHSDIVRQKWARSIYQPFLDRFLERLDHIFVTSRPLLEHSETLSSHTDKCSIVPLSVPVSIGPTTDSKRAEDTPLDSIDGPIVLFVGRLVYYKGLEHLLAAMETIDATLVIAGDGPRRTRFHRIVERRDIDDSVVFLGHVDEPTLDRCYERADVFVLPSTAPSEAFGLVQLEAMAHSTPVVNTDLPTGVPWVSKDGETGVTVPPAEPDALAGAITDLLSNPDLRTEYGANARRRAVERFSHERRLADVTAVYRRLRPSTTSSTKPGQKMGTD